ncbi:hypothetical protein [Sulfurimonas sp.]|uniref:hypothetical protein n=1 Tax=Sulfurimonas sp. TaxID=2022749 RepID=UPI003567955B
MTDNIFNRIKVQIKRTYYVYERYDTLATFALIYHEKKLSPEQLAGFLRVSDQFIMLDDNHYFINFTYTSQKDAFKASQNLLLYLDHFFNDSKTYIALDSFNTNYSPQVVLSRLRQILAETKKNSYSRIEDESILSGVF